MPQRLQISVSFENLEELEKAKSQVPSDVSASDYIRKKAFKLPHRNTRGGAPKKNKNNLHGRKGKREEI